MGFGSYDESEQRDPDIDDDEESGVSVHNVDHDGEVTFDTDLSTEDLVGKLDEMQSDEERSDDE